MPNKMAEWATTAQTWFGRTSQRATDEIPRKPEKVKIFKTKLETFTL
jgi:hypothetical protein